MSFSRIFVSALLLIVSSLFLLFSSCDHLSTPTAPTQVPSELKGTYRFIAQVYYQVNDGEVTNPDEYYYYDPYSVTLNEDGTWQGTLPFFTIFTSGFYTVLYPDVIFFRGSLNGDNRLQNRVDTLSIRFAVTEQGIKFIVPKYLPSDNTHQAYFAVRSDGVGNSIGGVLQTGNRSIPPVNTIVTARTRNGTTFATATDEFGFFVFSNLENDSIRFTASTPPYSMLDTTIWMGYRTNAAFLTMGFNIEQHGYPVPLPWIGSWDLLGEFRTLPYFYMFNNQYSTTAYPQRTLLTIFPNGRWSQTCSSDPSRNRSGYAYSPSSWSSLYCTFVIDSAANQSVVGDTFTYISEYNRFYFTTDFSDSGIVCVKSTHNTMVSGMVQMNSRYPLANAQIEYFDGREWNVVGYSTIFGDFSCQIPTTTVALRANISGIVGNTILHESIPSNQILGYNWTPVAGQNNFLNFNFTSNLYPVTVTVNTIPFTYPNGEVDLLLDNGIHTIHNRVDLSSRNFTRMNLNEGDYTVTVTKSGYTTVYAYLKVVGAHSELDVSMARVGITGENAVQGLVYNQNFTPFVGARVDVLHGTTVYTDSTGHFQLPANYCGTYGVQVSYPGYQSVRYNVNSEGYGSIVLFPINTTD